MGEGDRVDVARMVTGVSVPYVTQGSPDGIPVLLLHAWVESRRSFDRLLPLLPPTLRVIAMDQRGHGDADKPMTGYTLTDYAADVVAFMDAVGWFSAVLVGSSSGGYVAQQVAVDHPDRVAGLVLLGSPHSLQGRPAFADEVDALTDPLDRQWVAESLTWFPMFHEVPASYLDDRVEDGLRVPVRVWRDALAGLTEATPPTETGTIAAPTTVIWGERDDLLPRAQQDALCAAIPGARLVVYPDTGHVVLWEQPERVAVDVAGFVARLSG